MKDLESYLNEKIGELKQRISGAGLSSEQEKETESWFLRDFFLRPVERFASAGEIIPLSSLQKMQQVIRGVYPYWLDNDRIYALGKQKLKTLSLIGRDFGTQTELERWFREELLMPEEERPFVSVVMPTYNRAAVIGDAIQSVLDQTYDRLELIVVDDGSTDDTEAAVSSIRDPRLKFLKAGQNGGTSKAKNFGVREAQYELLAFHDDDDLWHPEKLARQVYELWHAPAEVGFCYCEMVYHRLDQVTVKYHPSRELSWERKNGNIYPELLRRNFVDGPTLLLKKEIFWSVGGFDEEMFVFDDWDLALRLSKNYDAIFVDEPLFDCYEHESSLSTDKSEERREKVESSVAKLEAMIARDKAAYGLSEISPEE